METENLNSPNIKTERQKKEETWFDVIKFVIILLVIIIPIRMFVIEPYMVRGHSMYPNFENNDYLLVEKWSTWDQKNYERGDIVIFKSPTNNGKTLIKRIIAIPNETIKIEKGKSFVATKKDSAGNWVFNELDEPFINSKSSNQSKNEEIIYSLDLEPMTLGSDEFFVMGDNRQASYDSRFWGALPMKNIIGRPIVRLYHFDNFGLWPAKIK